MRHTKIIATIGPASDDAAIIEGMIEGGVNVFRLNFSHGSQKGHRAVLERVREIAHRMQRAVAILQDLSGPKIRTGELQGDEPILLAPGDPLEIKIGLLEGRPGVISTTYAPLAEAVKPGDRLLLDDGRIELAVEARSPQSILTRVVDGGPLGEHKGINAPNVPLPAVGLTPKDEDDLRFGLSIGVDLVALSFVQSASDIAVARAIAESAGRPTVPIIAKLERPEAIQRLSEIVDAADAVMVARGDLGLEMPLEHVPQVQRQVLRLARECGIPAIVATQVLESMRTESRPTRAEVSDAAGAVDGGADAIMLSGETAIGDHPVRVVQVLDAIIRSAETIPSSIAAAISSEDDAGHVPALCDAAVTLAGRARVDAILGITRQGRTARLLSARRPSAPIYAITPSDEVARRLCLWWGIAPVVDALSGDAESICAHAVDALRDRGLLPTPATLVVVNASPTLDEHTTNFVRIARL